MIPSDCEELAQTNGLRLEALTRQFIYFSPPPTTLLRHTNDEEGSGILEVASGLAEAIAPEGGIEQWPEDTIEHLDLTVKELITQMTKLDPAARMTIVEVLEHPWWQRDV